MATQLQLGDIAVDVVLKDIKNVHLSVYPPTGRVRISAPAAHEPRHHPRLRHFQARLDQAAAGEARGQERETPREYLERESHYVWGKRYLLKVIECDEAPSVELKHRLMVLRLRPGADDARKQAVMEEWYREQIKQAVPPLIAKWEPVLGVKVARFYVQRMKTKWGSCNARGRKHSTQHRSGQEAAGMPRIHRSARDGTPARPASQRPVRWLDGRVSPELAAPPAGA